jgi:hypothetical protein
VIIIEFPAQNVCPQPDTDGRIIPSDKQGCLALLETFAYGLVDLGAVAAFIRWQGHYRIIDRGINRRLVIDGFVRFVPLTDSYAAAFVRFSRSIGKSA